MYMLCMYMHQIIMHDDIQVHPCRLPSQPTCLYLTYPGDPDPRDSIVCGDSVSLRRKSLPQSVIISQFFQKIAFLSKKKKIDTRARARACART